MTATEQYLLMRIKLLEEKEMAAELWQKRAKKLEMDLVDVNRTLMSRNKELAALKRIAGAPAPWQNAVKEKEQQIHNLYQQLDDIHNVIHRYD